MNNKQTPCINTRDSLGRVNMQVTLEDGFHMEKGNFTWKGMDIDTVTTFYDKKGIVEGGLLQL